MIIIKKYLIILGSDTSSPLLGVCCPPNCKTCNSSLVCSACNIGYNLDIIHNTCCPSTCSKCTESAGTYTCTNCLYGLSLNSNSVCCKANCLTCS